MVEKIDYNEINSMVKEYMKFHGMEQTLESLMAEERTKYYLNKGIKSNQLNHFPQVSVSFKLALRTTRK